MRLVILGGLVAMACVCSCNTARVPVTLDPIETVDEWARASARAQCDAMFRCAVPDHELLVSAIALGDEARCNDAFERILDAGLGFLAGVGPLSELGRLESEGRVHVDASRAQQCLDAENACWKTGPGVAACRDVIEGELPLGVACRLTAECSGDAYCDFDSDTCPGTCTARKAADATCRRAQECISDGFVECIRDPLANAGRCAGVTSTVAAGEGESCTFLGPTRVMCPPGLWCQPAQPGFFAGTCQRPLGVGEVCELPDDVCEAGAICHGPEGDRHCREVTLVSERQTVNAMGLPGCDLSEDSAPRFCDVLNGWSCGQDGVCEPTGDGAAGARCDATDLSAYAPCGAGLYCNPRSLQCAPTRMGGRVCEHDAECESYACAGNGGLGISTCLEEYCEVSP